MSQYKKLGTKAPGIPVEISTDAGMTAVLTAENVGKWYKFTGTTGTYTNGELYTVEPTPLTEPLCFTANTAGSTIKFSDVDETGFSLNSMQYSTNGTAWSTYTLEQVITLTNAGDKVYFKGNNSSGLNDEDTYAQFVMTGSIAASGNVMSLIYNGGTSLIIPSSCCLWYLFYGCTALTTAPMLPAITLTDYCYMGMFERCTSLVTAPALPATVLMEESYSEMFYGCTSLTTVPILPATTLGDFCYGNMFFGCTSLYVSDAPGTGYTNAWRIPSTDTFTNTYRQTTMFKNCLGTRSSDAMEGAAGASYTYYTQHPPINY